MSTGTLDAPSRETTSVQRRVIGTVGHAVVVGWRWFAAFRRTRPFWGALWLALAGLVIIHFARSPLTMVIGGGWNSSAGYILGGGMVMFAGVALFAPLYRGLVGIVGVLLGLAAFIAANLGGFLVGTLLAILGGSMIWAWGEKRPRKARRR